MLADRVGIVDFTAPGSSVWDATNRCEFHVSPSQVARVWQILDDTATTNGQNHDRWKLGAYEDTVSDNFHLWDEHGRVLDFDGDGRRDIAIWRPPVPGSPVDTEGEVKIRLATGATISRVLGRVYERPVPSDLDGDLKTDMAFWVPAQGIVPARLRFIESLGGHTGPIIDLPFAGANDTLLPNVDMDGNLATVELAVYDRLAGQVRWAPRSNPTSWTTRSLSVFGAGDDVMTGLYDADALTDFVAFGARTTATGSEYRFTLLSSVIGWNPLSVSFTAADDSLLRATALRSVDRDGNGRDDMAAVTKEGSQLVWRYFTLFNGIPGYWGADSWGSVTARDVAIGGFDFDHDGKSDPCVYRPATTDGALGQFIVMKTTGGTEIRKNLGTTGWVPFVSDNRFTTAKVPEFGVFEPRNYNWTFLTYNGSDWVTQQTVQWGKSRDAAW